MWIDEVFIGGRSEPPRRSVYSGESYILSQTISQMTFLQCCLRICKVMTPIETGLPMTLDDTRLPY